MFLAYKTMAFDADRLYFHPPSLPGWRMPRYRAINATCDQDHAVPDENHDCGIHLTTDLDSLKPYIDVAVPGEENIMVFSFQVLGRAFFDRETKILRAERVFPYSLVVTNEGHGRDWVDKNKHETVDHPISIAENMRIMLTTPEYIGDAAIHGWRSTRDHMGRNCPEWLGEVIRSWKPFRDEVNEDNEAEDDSTLGWLLSR